MHEVPNTLFWLMVALAAVGVVALLFLARMLWQVEKDGM